MIIRQLPKIIISTTEFDREYGLQKVMSNPYYLPQGRKTLIMYKETYTYKR